MKIAKVISCFMSKYQLKNITIDIKNNINLK